MVQVAKDAPEDYTFPVLEFRSTVSNDWGMANRKLEPDFERTRVFQGGRVVPFRYAEQSELTEDIREAVVGFPVWPITVTRKRPLIIKFAYNTSDDTCTMEGCNDPKNPAAAVQAGPSSKMEDNRTVLGTKWKPAADSHWVKINYSIRPY